MRGRRKLKLKRNLFFPLLIKTSHQRQLHVLCQSNDIISNQSHLSPYSPFTVLLLMWSQLFSGCHDRQASCPPKDQERLPKYIVTQGILWECAQLPVTSGINNVLKIQKTFKVGKRGKYVSPNRDLKRWSWEKLQFAWIRARLYPDLPRRWHVAMVKCLQRCARSRSPSGPVSGLSSALGCCPLQSQIPVS